MKNIDIPNKDALTINNDLNLILRLGMRRFHEIESQEEDMDEEHRKIFLGLLSLL